MRRLRRHSFGTFPLLLDQAQAIAPMGATKLAAAVLQAQKMLGSFIPNTKIQQVACRLHLGGA